MAYDSGICTPWITADDLDCEFADGTEDIVEQSVTAAIEVLFSLSGSQYPGLCETIIRPTACGCCGRDTCDYPGRWSDVTSAIGLGFSPVKEIIEVIVDGMVVPSTAYRLEEEYWLLRVDGNLWPCTQHRGQATTEMSTWSVELEYGEDVPSMGIIAAKDFACQLAAAQIPGAECSLPKNVKSITRLGVNLVLTDLAELIKERKTGLYSVDLFIETYNPDDLDSNFAIGIPTVNPTVLRET